jgi:phage terminase small subunit
MASNIYSVFTQASKVVKQEGYYQTTQSGYTQKTAHFQTILDCQKSLREFESLYGLNFNSRTKMNIGPPKRGERFNEYDKDFS